MKTRTRRLAAIATMALLSLPAMSIAQTPVAPVEVRGGNVVRVNYADLNTDTASGMSLLSARVDSAVTMVCRYYAGRLLEAPREFDCRQGAREAAWDQFASNEARSSYAHNGRWIEFAAIRPIEQ